MRTGVTDVVALDEKTSPGFFASQVVIATGGDRPASKNSTNDNLRHGRRMAAATGGAKLKEIGIYPVSSDSPDRPDGSGRFIF
jgi:aspartate oxidase